MALRELRVLVLIVVAWGALSGGAAAEGERMLFDFSKPESAKSWQPVNDGVMGGVSQGRFEITEQGTMKFLGTLSLENNGGFASVRTRRTALGLMSDDAITAKIKGDGREYLLNLYVPSGRTAYSYRAPIATKAGEWIEVRIPLRDLRATWFGRDLPNAGPVDGAKVDSIGLMLADKKPGPFALEVAWIKATANASAKDPSKAGN
ncbi:MAG: CIA30 family protein [Isosphaeraceae bacterium]|nr:CIA30 family protein [Isosphaeraceae bacterium]